VFGRATITLGIGPHSSVFSYFIVYFSVLVPCSKLHSLAFYCTLSICYHISYTISITLIMPAPRPAKSIPRSPRKGLKVAEIGLIFTS